MELTYRDVMDAKFDGLTTAAKQWRRMSRSFGTLRTDYTKQVSKKLTGWHGDSAGAFRISEMGILEQFDKAKHQATSMAQLLDNAHDMLTDAREALKAVRKAAVHEGGMKVDEYGKCTLDTSGMTGPEVQSALRDPSRAETERAWNNAIQRAVESVQQVDTLLMRALKAASADGDPRSGSVGFNGDAPKDFEAFAKDLAKRQAKKAEEAKEKSVHLSTDTLRGIVHGLNTATRTPGGLGDKVLAGTVEGVAEAGGYNNTRGLCASGSAGLGWDAGFEGCIVVTKRPDGGSQISYTRSVTTGSAGWEYGAGISASVLKSNADDLEHLKGPGWNKGGSFRLGPLGGEVNHSNAFNTFNAKGDPVQSVTYGAGPGLSAGISTGFSNTSGEVIWESPKQGADKSSR